MEKESSAMARDDERLHSKHKAHRDEKKRRSPREREER
jgi:hypothetical protein